MHWQHRRVEPISQTALILAIAIPSTVVILTAASILIWLLRKRWVEHKRALATLTEQGFAPILTRENTIPAFSQPTPGHRGSLFLPYISPVGWDTLQSEENLEQPCSDMQTHNRNSIISIPRPSRKRNRNKKQSSPNRRHSVVGKSIPLRKFKVVSRLSAILESPRSQATKTPSPALNGKEVDSPGETHPAFSRAPKSTPLSIVEDVEPFVHPGSPDPDARPSIAKKPKQAVSQEPELKDVSLRQPPTMTGRSFSSPVVWSLMPSAATSEKPMSQRPLAHTRSKSFCGQLPSQAPQDPVPPLPQTCFKTMGISRSRSNMERSPRRESISTIASGNSSILVNDAARRSKRQSQLQVDDKSLAQVREGASRELSHSMIVRPQPQRQSSLMGEQCQTGQNLTQAKASQALESRCDYSHLFRNTSTVSLENKSDCLPVARSREAERPSVDRVSSSNSVLSVGSSSKSRTSTVRRHSRSTVTLDGSPEERKKPTTRDESINPPTISRLQSYDSIESPHSNSAPIHEDFHEDICATDTKPSALKGSPKARKGHRRGNNVRISSQAPTVLGYAAGHTSRSSMVASDEDHLPDNYNTSPSLEDLALFSIRPLPELPGSSGLNLNRDPQLRPMRASLTSSSPTLSWTNYHQDPQASTMSSELDFRSFSNEQDQSRRNSSSILDIPNFPRPNQCYGAIEPTYCRSPPRFVLPHMESEQRGSSWFVLVRNLGIREVESTDSLRLDPACQDEDTCIDPCLRSVDLPWCESAYRQTHDQTGQAFSSDTLDLSSSLLNSSRTPLSSPNANGPVVQGSSENDDSMITYPSQSSSPALLTSSPLPSTDVEQSVEGMSFDPSQNADSPFLHTQIEPIKSQYPEPHSEVRENTCWPLVTESPSSSKNTVRNVPHGPRDLPAFPVRKSIQELRRMDSEASVFDDIGQKRWRKLGREASPVLPDLGFIDPAEIGSGITRPNYGKSPEHDNIWTGDLSFEDIPGSTPSRINEDEDTDMDDWAGIETQALEEEIARGLEIVEALEQEEQEEREARQKLGLEASYNATPPSHARSGAQQQTFASNGRQPLGVIGQGRSPVMMSSVPEEDDEAVYSSSEDAAVTRNVPQIRRKSPRTRAWTNSPRATGSSEIEISPNALSSKQKQRRLDIQAESDSIDEIENVAHAHRDSGSSNPWEDGEKFWEDTVKEARKCYVLEMQRRQQDRESRLESERWEELSRRGIRMEDGTLRKQEGYEGMAEENGSSSIQGTPRSLYDQRGFLSS
ncbi:MAG: hypothetical protein M1820_008271 [Bogoriella megaspora]|nr:MAG: hypothetical protein M1820_008271 [Bogoriella megaspora]